MEEDVYVIHLIRLVFRIYKELLQMKNKTIHIVQFKNEPMIQVDIYPQEIYKGPIST